MTFPPSPNSNIGKIEAKSGIGEIPAKEWKSAREMWDLENKLLKYVDGLSKLAWPVLGFEIRMNTKYVCILNETEAILWKLFIRL